MSAALAPDAPPARGLAMRIRCERCASPLAPDDLAFICSYECTYCAACSDGLDHRCANCGGELVRRPKRAAAVCESGS